MFLSPEKFALLIAIASGIPILLIVFVSFLLFHQNNLRKQQELNIMEAMLTTQEDERKRIASDLHDQIGPQLVGVKLLISIDQSSLSEKQSGNLAFAKSKLDEAIIEVRNISHNLYTGNIDAIGLTASLQEAAKSLESGNKKIVMDLNVDEQNLSYTHQINLYRICLELISNSLKHSNGDEISIQLKEDKDLIQLSYRDNGTSTTNSLTPTTFSKGLGMQSVKNRIRLLRGEILSYSTDYSKGSDFSFRFKKEKVN